MIYASLASTPEDYRQPVMLGRSLDLSGSEVLKGHYRRAAMSTTSTFLELCPDHAFDDLDFLPAVLLHQ